MVSVEIGILISAIAFIVLFIMMILNSMAAAKGKAGDTAACRRYSIYSALMSVFWMIVAGCTGALLAYIAPEAKSAGILSSLIR
jgi:hypothetical protein